MIWNFAKTDGIRVLGADLGTWQNFDPNEIWSCRMDEKLRMKTASGWNLLQWMKTSSGWNLLQWMKTSVGWNLLQWMKLPADEFCGWKRLGWKIGMKLTGCRLDQESAETLKPSISSKNCPNHLKLVAIDSKFQSVYTQKKWHLLPHFKNFSNLS